MGVLILPPVRGASKQGGAQPHTVKGGKIELASGVADKTTALPDEPPAHLPSKRRGLRYTSDTYRGGDRTATTAKGGPRPPLAESRSKRRHRQRRCRSLRRQGSEQGAARNERGAARANNLKQLNSTPFFYNCLCSFSHSGLTDILCYIGLSFLALIYRFKKSVGKRNTRQV